MTRSWTAYLAGATFALTAAAGGLAYAQSTPADAQRQAQQDAAHPADRTQRVERVEHQERGDRNEVYERRVIIHDNEGHHMDPADHLRTMLQLKPGQEGALTAYLAAVKPAHHHEQMVTMSNHGEAKTTPQRLAEMETKMSEQSAQGHARIDATRKFYDQLEPSQKKVFDELPMLMVGPMGPMMPMGPMKVMVSMDGMPPMPPMPPLPPMPPKPPAPPRL